MEDNYKTIDNAYSGDELNYIDNKTEKKFAYEKGPNPFVIDIKIFENLKRLEHLNLAKHDANGYRVKNLLLVTKMKKLKQLGMYGLPEIFPTSDLKKIKGLIEKPRDEFFNRCKRKNKKIKSQYDLKGKDSKKYDLLDRDIRFGWGYGDSIDDILKGRKKK